MSQTDKKKCFDQLNSAIDSIDIGIRSTIKSLKVTIMIREHSFKYSFINYYLKVPTGLPDTSTGSFQTFNITLHATNIVCIQIFHVVLLEEIIRWKTDRSFRKNVIFSTIITAIISSK